jgi:alkylated DNA repair dioxygenase AlkB
VAAVSAAACAARPAWLRRAGGGTLLRRRPHPTARADAGAGPAPITAPAMGDDNGEEGPRFRRPSSAAPTAHLRLRGPWAAAAAAGAALAPFAPLAVTRPHALAGQGDAAQAHASFATPAAAAAALAAVAAGAVGPLVAAFAEPNPARRRRAAPERAPAAEPPPAELSAAACGVPGLSLLLDFVTPAEEATILALVDARPWAAAARRRVQHYGSAWCYATRSLENGAGRAPPPPLPDELRWLRGRLGAAAPALAAADQLTVNEYGPGAGIAAHVEAHGAFGDALAGLSLGGPAAMAFCRGSRAVALLLPPRSLLILEGEARLCWEHSIAPRRADPLAGGAASERGERRVSLTFRTARRGACACAWPGDCDSQGGRLSLRATAKARGGQGGGGGGGEG